MAHCYTKHIECPDISCSECTIKLKMICKYCGTEMRHTPSIEVFTCNNCDARLIDNSRTREDPKFKNFFKRNNMILSDQWYRGNV